ncbi:MAG: methionine synthase [Acidimicrobiales bacterium]
MDRILTTHAGSLPRPPELVSLLARLARGEDIDDAALAGQVEAAVTAVVDRQRQAGLDVVNDGEQGRESFFTYVQHRMTGFGPGDPADARRWSDVDEFPGFAAIRRAQRTAAEQVSLVRPPQAVGEVDYGDPGAIDAEIDRLARATAGGSFADVFMTAPSPGIVVAAMANHHYLTDDDYLEAVGSALAVEYRRIVDAGFVLQIDAPDLAMERHGRYADRPLSDFLGFVDRVVATTNRALDGIEPGRVRLHVCWGNYGGPHVHDVDLAELLPLLYRTHVGGLVVSGGNPRHEHEYRTFARHPLPDGWTLATGVIDTTTNYVEHPEVVADRVVRVAEAVGDPGRVLACTDCGFDTAAGFSPVAADVAWEKLRSLRAGADLASARLFPR